MRFHIDKDFSGKSEFVHIKNSAVIIKVYASAKKQKLGQLVAPTLSAWEKNL